MGWFASSLADRWVLLNQWRKIMTIKQIGIDIGKTTFHVLGIGGDDTIVLRKQFSRS